MENLKINNKKKSDHKAAKVGLAAMALGIGAAAVKALSNEKTREKVIDAIYDMKDQISDSKKPQAATKKVLVKAKKVAVKKTKKSLK